MITGSVNENNEAVISLQMRGSNRQFEAIIDTGFQGADLLLPRAVIRQLGLELANEQDALFDFYNGEVMWHSGFKPVRILESENSYLASADLLAGSRILIDMTPGGTVAITELPSF